MRGLFCNSAAAALLAATSLAFAVPVSAAGLSVRTLAAQEARLATMAYRMATANPDICRRPEMMTGMILHDLTQYQPARRSEVARAFSLHSGFGILQLVPGSAAERAGLRIDDEIIAVGGTSVDHPAAVWTSAKSFHRMQEFSDLLQARLGRGPTPLLIRRSGQVQQVMLSAERGCGGQLSLANSPGLSAWADGRHLVLTTGMNAFARSDDEIAFVIAHEMSHNILGHFGQRGSKMGIFGRRARDLELDADGFAVRLMGAAGYRPRAGISFLEHSRRRLWWAFSLDHPGFGSRIQTVAAEIAKWPQATLPYHQAVVARVKPGETARGPAIGATETATPRIVSSTLSAAPFVATSTELLILGKVTQAY